VSLDAVKHIIASSNLQRELLCLAMKALYCGMCGSRSTTRYAVLGMPSNAGIPQRLAHS